MGTITTAGTLFNSELVAEVFKKAKGHSSLAKLCGSIPLTFAGVDNFVFTMDGEASIVGEGGNKPAGEAEYKSVTIKPVKIVYQHRVSDEFVNLAEEKQVPYLENFTDGFSKKIARAIDIMALHGVNPATNTTSSAISGKCFDDGQKYRCTGCSQGFEQHFGKHSCCCKRYTVGTRLQRTNDVHQRWTVALFSSQRTKGTRYFTSEIRWTGVVFA